MKIDHKAINSRVVRSLFNAGLVSLSLGLMTGPAALAGSFLTDVPALGFSVANMDTQVDPRQDFYRYASGNWLKRTEIPATEADVGGFILLANNLNDKLLKIVQAAADAPVASRNASSQQIGDFYRAAMDVKQLDKLGLKPLQADLQRLAKITGAGEMGEVLARLQMGYVVSPLLNAYTSPDPRQSTMNVLMINPGVRTLGPDEYAKPEGQHIRDLYLDFMANMFQSVGDAPEQARSHARTVLSIESELSAAELTPLQQRDPAVTYNKLTLAKAQALITAIDLRTFITGLGMTPPETMLVPDLQGLRAVQKVLNQRSEEDVRTLLRWHVLSARTSALGQPWYGLDREFNRQRVGLQSSEPREREVTKAIASLLFHPLSKLYVEAHFPETTRRDITQMVAHIKAEFEQRLRTNPWLDEPTRQAALEKLGKLDIAVGYPDTWIDFSGVVIKPDDYFGNVQRVQQFLMQRDFAMLGKPVVIERFAGPDITTPVSVNAAYNPQYNNVDITAAIVQPPFYVPGADAAVNYCTMGAVIGHELTHGFDSMGRQFGPEGNLQDWWTPSATAEFTKRTDVLVDQYSQYQILPGLMHNGRQTLTENTADLGGITLAHAALQRHLGGKPAPLIDGMSSDQRCFVAWSQMWAYKARSERLRYLVSVDYHAIASVRAVAPLLNLDAFHQAFGTREGDPMWRAPQQRVRIW